MTSLAWRTIGTDQLTLEGVLEIGDGYRAKNSEMSQSGLPFARAGNINNGLHFEDADILDEASVAKAGDKTSRPGDIVFTSKGTVGRFAFVTSTTQPFAYSPQLCYWRVRDTSVIDPHFLYCWMRGREFMDQVSGVKGLTDMADYVSLYDQRRMKITLPPLPTQRKIAAVLSAYDDLIENNTRRIALLEETARALYREWFVEFRYPGHASVPLVESPLGPIPQGWRVVKLGDAVELAYGKALTAEGRNEGSVPVYGSSGIVGYHDSPLVDGPGIIVGRKGNVGSVHWSDEAFYPIDTVYFVRSKIPLPYLYFNLQSQRFINNDAAVPGLNRNQAYSLPLLIPSPEALTSFVDFINPVFAQVRTIRQANANLRRTRDLLLPKLVSGEVDVEGVEIEVDEEVG
ncbi:MAG TPA: restriction endonuclease subunit S [Ktedonobacterales bacterium]|nr:restriction endonuclease subunit S [Ktedonobacterales bacterium]